MADFRKWFLVVAVVLLTAASASAQQSFAMPCNMTGQTQIIRVGGVTEPVGEIDLACDSTQLTPLGASVTAQWTLQVNATITNAVNDDGSGKTMAAVAVQYNRAPFAIQHMVRGVPAGPPGILQFPNVVLPTGTTFTMRFFNVRVSALTLVNPPSSPGGYPEVVGLVTANAFNPSGWSVTFPQTVAPVLIGQVVQDFNFAVTACDGSTPAPSVALQQCVDYVLNPGPFPGFKAAPVFGVTFTEANSLSFSEFKNLIEEDLATIPNPSAPAAAGFPAATDDPLVCDTAHDGTGTVSVMSDVPPIEPCNGQPAWVSNGTKLVAKFTLDQRLVGKLHIWVTEFPTHASAKANAELQVVGNPNAWGSGGFTEGPRVTQCGPGGNHWVLLTDDAQTKVAGWEITSDDFSGIDTLTFGVAITYTESQIPSLPAGSTYDPIVIAGNIGPIDPLAAAMRVLGQVPAKAPVVRFAHPDIPGSVQPTIQHCVTNLLFPYVTNIVGFETGIAISNTSLDTAWNLTDPPS